MFFFKKRKEEPGRKSRKSTLKKHKENITAPLIELKSRFKNIQAQSKVEPPNRFDDLLASWNIRYDELPLVHRQLKIRAGIFVATVVIIGGLLIAQGYVFATLLIIVPAFVGLVTSLWRIYMIKNKLYIPFKKWFLLKKSDEEALNNPSHPENDEESDE